MGQPWEPFTLGLFDVNTSYTCVLECRVKLKTAQLTRSGSQALERPGDPSQKADPCATHDDPIRTAESLRAAYRRFAKTSVRTPGESTQRAEVHSMERVVENPNDLSLEDRRPSRVTTSQMNTNHAYDSATSDGANTAQQTLIVSTRGANETKSASSGHESELLKGKRPIWSESEHEHRAVIAAHNKAAQNTVFESQPDEVEENTSHRVFGEVAGLQYNIE
ncbi:hypothetical protein V3C99_014985 [Haemonchus contortus]|uniref:Uncharacterized protein n=1 Tax=Haemonchus contortus TaxID=6289 RepID=A0A7I4YUV2_HAECO